MKTLVKLGGTLLETESGRASIAAQISACFAQNPQLAVVHGGGKQMTRFLEERGVPSEFVDGLRVSSPAVIDAVLKVFAGTVNHELVASLVAAGSPAIGLSGVDAALTECTVLRPELGQVGVPAQTNTKILDVLCGNQFLPVVACVGGDRKGNIYNVNGDQMASAVAAGWGAERLFFLTDVEGVRGADGLRIPVLNPTSAEELIATGVAVGGMMAKLRSALSALASGVGEVWILPGQAENVLVRALAGEDFGTRLVN
jgi:acetylglutamate kinase